MNASLHEFVIERLQRTKGDWPRVASGSGVALRTLEKIARKEIRDPGVSHIEKLANYFHDIEAQPEPAADDEVRAMQ